MDPATLIGIVGAFAVILSVIFLEGANVSSILLPGPLLLVFGGTIAVTVASVTLPDSIRAAKALPKAFTAKALSPHAEIDKIVAFAERARKDGLLALEQEAENAGDPFLKRALQGIADGVDPEDLRLMLEEEMLTRERTDRQAAKFYTTMGGYSPTIGIIGTVISLTHVLENLSEPETLGHSIAAAFVATLWGVLSANVIFLPIGNRLVRIAELEVERMTLQLEGMMAVQSGSQPRALRERLLVMVPGGAAPKVKAAKEPATGTPAPAAAEAV
jgi:chemotaxis protein MotA